MARANSARHFETCSSARVIVFSVWSCSLVFILLEYGTPQRKSIPKSNYFRGA